MAVMPSVNNRMHAETLREVARSNYRLQDIQFHLRPRASVDKLFDIVWDDPPSTSARGASEGGSPGTKFAGGHRSRVTPVPIPNTEVKPATADGTAWETVWESRSLPAFSLGVRRQLDRQHTVSHAGMGSILGGASQARPRCGRVGRCRHFFNVYAGSSIASTRFPMRAW